MKLSSLNFSLFMLTTLPFFTHTMYTPVVTWKEVSDSTKNTFTITAQTKGSCNGIDGLIEVSKVLALDTQKQIRFFGTITSSNQSKTVLPFSQVALSYDQMAALHLIDLQKEAEKRAENDRAKARLAAIKHNW